MLSARETDFGGGELDVGGDLAALWAAGPMELLSIEATRRRHERTEPSP